MLRIQRRKTEARRPRSQRDFVGSRVVNLVDDAYTRTAVPPHVFLAGARGGRAVARPLLRRVAPVVCRRQQSSLHGFERFELFSAGTCWRGKLAICAEGRGCVGLTVFDSAQVADVCVEASADRQMVRGLVCRAVMISNGLARGKQQAAGQAGPATAEERVAGRSAGAHTLSGPCPAQPLP